MIPESHTTLGGIWRYTFNWYFISALFFTNFFYAFTSGFSLCFTFPAARNSLFSSKLPTILFFYFDRRLVSFFPYFQTFLPLPQDVHWLRNFIFIRKHAVLWQMIDIQSSWFFPSWRFVCSCTFSFQKLRYVWFFGFLVTIANSNLHRNNMSTDSSSVARTRRQIQVNDFGAVISRVDFEIATLFIQTNLFASPKV